MAARELIEQLKQSPLKESKRAMEGLAEMDLLLEYLDIYGAVDKVCVQLITASRFAYI